MEKQPEKAARLSRRQYAAQRKTAGNTKIVSSEKQGGRSRKSQRKDRGSAAIPAAIALLCVFGALLGVAAGRSVYVALQGLSAPTVPIATREAVQETPGPSVAPSPPPSFAPTPQAEDRAVDFDALKEQNEDIVAWISVPGTDIDYPVVYGNLDGGFDLENGVRFYLNHNEKKQSDKNGAIFLAEENAPGFSDRNTVIYGHNMRDGSMFASLHEFEDPVFFDQNRLIKIYTPEGQYNYTIIAAGEAGNSNILYRTDFGDDGYFAAYLRGITAGREESANVTDPGLTVDDKLITLSTCVTDEREKRYLVHGVLTEG